MPVTTFARSPVTVGQDHRDEPGLRPSQKVKSASQGQDQQGSNPGTDTRTAHPRQGPRTRAALCRGSQGKRGGPSRLLLAFRHTALFTAL